MAYIGRDVDKISNVEVLDNITFDGSSSYTLQKGGSNFTPSSANTILLSIDGVVQAGNFTVSGSTIDFGTAVAGTSTCDFVLHYGVGLITSVSDGTVTTAKLADSSVTAAKITDATITAAKLASGTVQNQSAFKNIIINGDMSIAQRGTSESSYTSDTYSTVDRMKTRVGSLGTWTISQSTDVPSGQGFAKSLKWDCTTADASPSASDFLFLEHKIEGQNLQYLKYGTSSAESTTLSFWVKSNKTGTGQVNLRDYDNDKLLGGTYTISSADTWEKKTITYIGNTSDTLDNDNAVSLALEFWLDSGSTYTGGTAPTAWEARDQTDRNASGTLSLGDSTSNEWYITGVQLEAGTSASDFEFLPHDVNLQRCLRYYYHHAEKTGSQNPQIGMGTYTTSTRIDIIVFYPVTMRTDPSLISTSSEVYYIYGQADYFSNISGSANSTENCALLHSINDGASGTAGQAGVVSINGSGGIIAFNSEL